MRGLIVLYLLFGDWRAGAGGGELEVESPAVLNYLFEQIIVVEDKLKEEVESEKNF